MRRAILAVLAGGVLLTGTACDSDADTSESAAPAAAEATSTPPATAPAPDYAADTTKVCGRLDEIFSAALAGEFGAAMGKMIAQKEAKQAEEVKNAEKAAAAELKAVGTQIRKETGAAQDPELKAAGETSAAKIEQSAKDRDYIEKVKTSKDLDRTLKSQIQEWLSPVSGYCA
ncbi:hypothetical protein [Actinoplanes aureus]|uniref:Lipoprotein n=1 Tax=Actinoplanes aureus TaxID=2792083 RepID=A0A931CF18_9ACTN|nr:hypothetical protein [Actinoplanes aureus]MBG0568929.1 hypothetical protein [Actinoplanes aureus]